MCQLSQAISGGRQTKAVGGVEKDSNIRLLRPSIKSEGVQVAQVSRFLVLFLRFCFFPCSRLFVNLMSGLPEEMNGKLQDVMLRAELAKTNTWPSRTRGSYLN